MMDNVFWIVALLLAAVVFVLARGLHTYTKDGDDNRRRSNRLMRWRVALQFATVAALALLAALGFTPR
ncbi:MAG: twin transmembrane helix small protein [Pseudomonadota bacterium]